MQDRKPMPSRSRKSSRFKEHLEQGLTQKEAYERLQKLGANELTQKPRPGFLALLWDQFNNYLVIILIIAALIALGLGEWIDSIAIMCIVVLNAIVGVIQESKAEQALAALKKLARRRTGHPRWHPVHGTQRELVPATSLPLSPQLRPADMRLVSSVNLRSKRPR